MRALILGFVAAALFAATPADASPVGAFFTQDVPAAARAAGRVTKSAYFATEQTVVGAARATGSAVSSAAKAIGTAVSDAAKATGAAISEAAQPLLW